MSIIEVDGLAKTFRSRVHAAGLANSLRSSLAPTYHEREAVRRISFSLEAGEMLALLAPTARASPQPLKC